MAGKNAPSVAVAGQKVPMNVAPSVVELYAEPSAFTWNMYRRVVAAGQCVVFHFYFDQPALRVRLWIGNDGPRESLVKHENIAPAYKVHKPCANNANLDAWLARKGLVALTETVAHPGTFDSDDDFLDAQINALHDSRVSDGNGGTLPCRGFWVLKGDGNFRVKRLCVKRKALTDQAGVTENAQCSDTEDRVSRHVARVQLPRRQGDAHGRHDVRRQSAGRSATNQMADTERVEFAVGSRDVVRHGHRRFLSRRAKRRRRRGGGDEPRGGRFRREQIV